MDEISVRVNPEKIGNIPAVTTSIFDFRVPAITTPKPNNEQVLAAHGTPPAQADIANSCLFSPVPRRSPRGAFPFAIHPMSPSWATTPGTTGTTISRRAAQNTEDVKESALQVRGYNVWTKSNSRSVQATSSSLPMVQ
eukprot:757276-Amorphochlora_amoeboformis.AAC.1